MAAPDTAPASLLLGLLGEHIGGSLTPMMHEREARRTGVSLVYRLLDSVAMGLDGPDWPALIETAARFTFDGLNVTHPAKQAVIPALDDLSEDARLLGAVNTVRFVDGRAIGMNTDHRGFAEAFGVHGIDPGAGEVVQLGAGGAGSATAYALLAAGVPRLTLVDVDVARCEALIRRLSTAFDAGRMRTAAPEEAPALVRAADGLVNSTPVGMTGVSSESPIALDALHSDLWVGDVVYRPLRTTLVRAAEQLGCRTFGGAQMVVGQAAAAYEIFTGAPADRAAMHADFEGAVALTGTPA